MIVREAYRDSTVSICHDHYHERKPLPEDAPALGPVQDARPSACVYCERERLHVYVIEEADGDLRYVALTYEDYRAVVDDPAMIDHVTPLACYVETSSASEPGERIGDWWPLARGEDTPEGREAIRVYRERH